MASSSTSTSSVNGRVLGDFQLKEQLGSGGGGTVYLAEQLTLRREAVVKIVAKSDRASAERFLREARLASQLDHPFAAHIYDFGHESDGLLWLAMELVRGAPLNEIIKNQGPLALARFVPLFERIAEVLQAAHDQGIVHRDIKPANVMVINRAGRLLPKLLDLGIGRRVRSVEKPGGDSVASSPSGLLSLTLFDEPTTSQDPTPSDQTLANQLEGSETLELTRAGSVIGTPHYMPPEQWHDASSATAQSDQYSLALLAYQALTGEAPFRGKSVRHLMLAHAREPLPPLPDRLPAQLHAVLARAAAKTPEARYASVTEFAAALRAASGLELEPVTLPQLPEDVRENVRGAAPQPIAEAMVLIESASTPKQQLHALGTMLKVVGRYVAVVALAARSRVGPGQATESPRVVELCDQLRRARLADHEWLTLALELCRPFAYQRAVHPMPGLVSFFFAPGTQQTNGTGFSLLVEVAATLAGAKAAPEGELQPLLTNAVRQLGQLLSGLHFMYDYPLVVVRDRAERWVGARRSHRVPQTPFHADAPSVGPGSVLLVDDAGVPTVVLSPLLQVLAPGPGMADELFFVDGDGRHGARLVSLPAEFERQSDELWPWFRAHLGTSSVDPNGPQAVERPPFKGLSTFTPEDADNYFGREREAEAFANRLRVSKLLAVVGPSGSGKSSFVLAGVLPLLPAGVRPVVFRPGANPFEAASSRLGSTLAVTAHVPLDPKRLLELLPTGESLLLVVDQFEELVTLCADAPTRQAFASALVTLADDPSGRFRVVCTLRDDFLIRVQQLGPLRERLSGSLQLLSTPAPDDLLRVLTEPTKRVGYQFDDPALPAKMVEHVAEYPGALALLSFTASQLWELRDRHLRQLRSQTYEALGGVGGALAHHAEATLAAMSEADAKLVREVFRHLVTSSMTRAVMSRVDMLEVLGGHATAASVLDRLISARLLVASEEGGGDDRVELIHEALIVSWPRLVGWLREDAETARLRDALRASARQWGERGRPAGLLWRKEALAEYRVWRGRFTGRLTQLEQAFAHASLREEARATLIRRASVGAVVAALVVGLVVLYRSNARAEQNAAESKARLQRLWQEQGRLAMADGRPMEALVYTRAAKGLGASSPAVDQVIAYAAAALDGSHGTLVKLQGQITEMAVSDDHAWLLARAPEQTMLVSLVDLSRRRVWPTQCFGLAFTADSKHAFITCDETAQSVDLATLESKTLTLPASTYEVSRNVRGHFVGAEFGSTLHEYSANGSSTVLFEAPGVPSLNAVPSLDGTTFVFAGKSAFTPSSLHRVLAVDPEGRVVWQSPPSDAQVLRVVENPRTLDVAIARDDGSVAVFDHGHRQLWDLPVSQSRVADLSFAGDLLLCPQSDGLLAARDAKTGAPRYLRAIASSGLQKVVVSDDGQDAFLAVADGTVRRVDVASGGLVFVHHGHHGPVNALLLSGERLLSGGQDATLRLWNPHVPFRERLSDEPVLVARATPEGFDAVTEHSIVRVKGLSPPIVTPRPPHDPTRALYDFFYSPSGDHAYFLYNKGIDVYEGQRKVWSVEGDMTFGAMDAVHGRVAYASTTSEGTKLVEVDHPTKSPLAIPTLENSSDMLLVNDLLLGNNAKDLTYIDLRHPESVKTAPGHGGGIFNFVVTPRADTVLTIGVGKLLVWRLDDLSKARYRIETLRSAPLTAGVDNALTLAAAVLSDGSYVAYDVREGQLLAQFPLAQKDGVASINLEAEAVLFQNRNGELMRAKLPHVPAFADDAALDAFIEKRISLKLEGEKLVTRE